MLGPLCQDFVEVDYILKKTFPLQNITRLIYVVE